MFIQNSKDLRIGILFYISLGFDEYKVNIEHNYVQYMNTAYGITFFTTYIRITDYGNNILQILFEIEKEFDVNLRTRITR